MSTLLRDDPGPGELAALRYAPLSETPGSWTFEDQELAAHFGAHVREQLPWYDLATRLVVHVAQHSIRPDGLAYDVGAATGNISVQGHRAAHGQVGDGVA